MLSGANIVASATYDEYGKTLQEPAQVDTRDEVFDDINDFSGPLLDPEPFHISVGRHEYAEVVEWDEALSPAWPQELSSNSGTPHCDPLWFEPVVGRYVCPQELTLSPLRPNISFHHVHQAEENTSWPLVNYGTGLGVPPGQRAYQLGPPSLHTGQTLRSPALANQTSQTHTELFRDWLLKNATDPYPSEAQVLELAGTTGLTAHRVRICLNNLRTRMKASKSSPLYQECNTQSSSHISAFLADSSSKILDIGQNTTEASHISFRMDGNVNQFNDQFYPIRGQQSTYSEEQSSVSNHTRIMDINHTASTQRRDLALFRRSHERARKRKGKRFYASRYVSGATESSGTSTLDDSNDSPTGHHPTYYCTVCPKAFKNVYGWRRHEASVHGYHTTEWVCMLDGAIVDGINCVFCSEIFPELDHNEQHSILKCLSKTESERTFLRKDAMKQHIQQVHLADMDTPAKKTFKVPDTWCRDVEARMSDPAGLWCGICQSSFETTTNRMDHVAEHFRNGSDMSKWLPRLAH